MKSRLALATMLLLAACHSKPDVAKIKADATAKLQQQLDGDFGKGKATVRGIDFVETTAPHYEGFAQIAIGTKFIALPVRVTSDGTTTIVEDDDAPVGRSVQAGALSAVTALEGKYSDYVLSPSLFSRFPPELQRDKAKFVERMQTVVPIVHQDGGYFGSGCMAHSCATDAAAWFVNDDGSRFSAIVLETDSPTPEGEKDGITPLPNFHIYGSNHTELPAPLASWAQNLGMNDGNISGTIDYVPPGADN